MFYLLLAPSLTSKQYLTVSRIKKDSWNYELADSSDNLNDITLQFIHVKYKTLKKSSDYIVFCPLFAGLYVWTLKKIWEMQK